MEPYYGRALESTLRGCDWPMLEVTMPRLDESMRTGKLIEWLRNEGDRIEEGQPIALVEGEKTTFEIEAPASGILHKILHSPGSEVPVDEPIALIAPDTK
jgi:pyruvate dehydrogenase E2 component (dihydrolipoamide acetyltransferase)